MTVYAPVWTAAAAMMPLSRTSRSWSGSVENSEYPENWQYYVRGTFTKYNKDFGEDVLHMNSLGFDQISIEPVVADPNAALCADAMKICPSVFEEYERLAKIMLETQRARRGLQLLPLHARPGPGALRHQTAAWAAAAAMSM